MSTTIVRTPASRCEFGIGVADITPPVGMYHRMWGAAAHDRSTGVHRPLRATVAIMRPLADAAVDWKPLGGETSRPQTVIVSLDHCLLRAPEMEELLRELTQLTGLSRSELLITFSHTHSAGYLSRDRADLPGGDLIGPYLDALPGQIAEAFRSAQAKLQPATLTYGSTTCQMGANRDYFDAARGHFVCGFNPDGAVPMPLNVVRVTAADTKPLATIVNYPCHSTTLAWENTQVSPDYIGSLRDVVEQQTQATCLFLLAPCGDIGPRDGYVGDVSVADRNGRQVGFAALSVLEGMPRPNTDHVYAGPVFSGATLGAWHWHEWDASRRAATAAAKHVGFETPLSYLPTLPKLADAEQRHRELIAEEQAARAAGDTERAATLRTLVERQFRLLHRIAPLPPGNYPMPAWAWQWGDAFWVATEGETYHFLQAELARRVANRPLISITLANGTNCSYVPTREAFDRNGLYQTEVALLAPDSLERLTDALAARLAAWNDARRV